MSLLRLDAGILPGTWASAELADVLEAEWSGARPQEPVVRRHLGNHRYRPKPGGLRSPPASRRSRAHPGPARRPGPGRRAGGGADRRGCRPAGGPALQLRRLPALQDLYRPCQS